MANFLDITQVYIEKKVQAAGQQAIPTAAMIQDPNFQAASFLNSNVSSGGNIKITFRNIAATLDIERVTTFTRYYNVETNQFEGNVLEVKLEGGGDGGLIHVRSTMGDWKTFMGL